MVVLGGLYTSVMSNQGANCSVGFNMSENAEWFVKHPVITIGLLANPLVIFCWY